MKKIFAKPEMQIKLFEKESIMTNSTGYTGTRGEPGDGADIRTIKWSDIVG